MVFTFCYMPPNGIRILNATQWSSNIPTPPPSPPLPTRTPAKDTTRTPPGHPQDTPRTPPGHNQDTTRTPPGHHQDTFRTPPGHLQDTTHTRTPPGPHQPPGHQDTRTPPCHDFRQPQPHPTPHTPHPPPNPPRAPKTSMTLTTPHPTPPTRKQNLPMRPIKVG
jgi:hypothetical protein